MLSSQEYFILYVNTINGAQHTANGLAFHLLLLPASGPHMAWKEQEGLWTQSRSLYLLLGMSHWEQVL